MLLDMLTALGGFFIGHYARVMSFSFARLMEAALWYVMLVTSARVEPIATLVALAVCFFWREKSDAVGINKQG